MIYCDDLCFSYLPNEKEAKNTLNHIQLQIQKGEWVALIGANGSGKSTLAKHLNGLFIPQQGKVMVDGMDASDKKNLLAIRTKVAYIMQNPDNQIVASTVEEDTAFALENLSLPPEEIQRKVNKILQWMGLYEAKEKMAATLSGGQKQKLAIAGALVCEPTYLVADEPTSMLDPVGQKEVMAAFARMHREKGMGIIHITHRLMEAALAQRILVMDEGEIVLQGTPQEIFAQGPILEKYHLHIPPIAELANVLAQEGYPGLQGVLSVEELVTQLCQFA